MKELLDLSVLNGEGSHAVEEKRWPITDHHGYIVATTEIIAGNHNDAYELKAYLQCAFKTVKRLGLSIVRTLFNADSAFDTRDARKGCFNHPQHC